MTIRERLAVADPKNAQMQRDLVVSYNNLGDATVQKGQAKEALDFYRKAVAIAERLAAAHPKDAQAQRDLAPATTGLATYRSSRAGRRNQSDFTRRR